METMRTKNTDTQTPFATSSGNQNIGKRKRIIVTSGDSPRRYPGWEQDRKDLFEAFGLVPPVPGRERYYEELRIAARSAFEAATVASSGDHPWSERMLDLATRDLLRA